MFANEYNQNLYGYSFFTKSDKLVILLEYVDGILISGSNVLVIKELKELLRIKLRIKNIGNLRYFLGIKVE